MIGALHTRARCDECTRPATRDGVGGFVFCEGCAMGLPRPARDDLLGAIFNAPRICTRCQIRPAMLRVDEIRALCSECWRALDARPLDDIDSDPLPSAVPAPDVKVTVAVLPSAPATGAAVTPLSRDGASRPPTITRGDCPGTESPARFDSLEILDLASVLSGDPGACSSEREDVGAPNSESRACEGNGWNADGSKTSDGSAQYSSGDGPGIQQPRSIEQGRARDRAICPAVSGNSSCGRDSSPDLTSGGIDDGTTFDGSHTVAAARPRRAGIASGPQDSIATGNNPTPADVPGGDVAGRDTIPDAELESIIDSLEREWVPGAMPDLCAKYDATSRSFAAIDSAANSKSVSESRA